MERPRFQLTPPPPRLPRYVVFLDDARFLRFPPQFFFKRVLLRIVLNTGCVHLNIFRIILPPRPTVRFALYRFLAAIQCLVIFSFRFGIIIYEKMDISGYGQNVLGAMTVAIIAGVAWCVRNKFKHSNCELDSGCLKVTSHEDEEGRNTIRREILDQLRAEGVIPAPVVEEVASAVSETNL